MSRGRRASGTREEPRPERFSTRRHLLAATGGAGLSLVAGCSMSSEDGPAPSDERIPYNADSVAIDDHPMSEPAQFTDAHHCPVCNMQPVDYPVWGCQLTHADGTGLFFESPGCLLAYRAVTRSHPTDASIERVWFTDHDTVELFDAADGYLVRETELETQAEPMSGSPVPFATEARAEAYVEEAAHLGADAIVTLADVDHEFAEFYRGRRMP